MRDTAIRRALGAGRVQLFRPIIMESLLIAFTGGGLGVLLAYAGVQVLVITSPANIPRLDEVHVDITTLLFAFSVSASCGILCGLWPAFRLISTQPAGAPASQCACVPNRRQTASHNRGIRHKFRSHQRRSCAPESVETWSSDANIETAC
jgi:FtsX-like permease family